MPTDEVLFDKRDHVAYITIDRPERRNALSIEVTAALIEAFTDAADDDDVWAIVLTGTGEKAFCAGGDLKQYDELARQGIQIPVPMHGRERNLYETVLETYKPTIAVLNGPAVGGGSELALACDIRIAAEHATLMMPEVKRGMGANFATVLLPRLLPRGIAMEMLYLGEPMSAEDALRWGLYNRVVPADRIQEEGERFVRALVANAPLTLRRYKEMAVKGWELSVHHALRLEVGPNPYTSEDRAEGVRAFLERRQPQWKGR